MRATLAFAATLLLLSCSRGGDGSEPGPDRPVGDPHAARQSPRPEPSRSERAARVILTTAAGVEITVPVEVVSTPRARTRGLMYRQHLHPDGGMLFLFDEQVIQRFWMKNTLIPLDMLFIDETMTVVGIVANAEPQTTTSRFVDKPSIYVLEVNGGWSHPRGVSAGVKVVFENVER